jgi:uncharacterized lipoprotein YmbA
MRIPLLLIAVSSVLISACSTTPQARSTYLLRSSSHVGTGELAKVGDAYLGTVQVASYIDQPGLVLELAEGMIHTAKQHHWAEPLRVSLREFLNVEISAANEEALATIPPGGAAADRIDVRISQLHGDAQGHAVLVASWSLSSAKQRHEYQFAETTSLDAVGYEALVTAETKLLVQLSKAIAHELK